MSSTAVPAADAFDWFADVVARALAPTAIKYEEPENFRADAETLDLGPVQVSTFSYAPLQSWRTPALIRQGDPEQYQLAFVTGSPMWIAQRGNDSGLVTGDMVLWDTSHPYTSGAQNEGCLVRAVVLQMPRTALVAPRDKVDRMLAQRIPGTTGFGAVLAQFLTTTSAHGADCEPHERIRLGRIAVDLAAACLATRLDTFDELPVEVREQALREQIRAYIDDNLGSTDLTPQDIAARFHISVRRLHLLFQRQDESVAASIRRRRLERCHTDLSRPEWLTRPVQAIANRWGFTSASVFSRAFRDAYGISPSELRREVAGDPRA